jgi:hypothetical protein
MPISTSGPREFLRLLRIVVPILLVLSAVTVSGGTFLPARAQTAAFTFNHPVEVSVGQEGFEPDLRIEHPGAYYSSVPNGFASTISFMWRTLDQGDSWKLVPDSSGDGTGKLLTTCVGGGDTEMVIDPQNRLYFNDLQGLTNFSTSRSTDKGTTFQSSCAGTPENTLVDRQWYAVDGDPYNGGHIFLAYDQVAQSKDIGCGLGNNQLVLTESPPPGVVPPAAAGVAGLEFGPQDQASCQEGIMGNDEVSPRVDPQYHQHWVFDVHDNAAFNSVYMLRCQQVPVTVNPSGLACTDHLVYHNADMNVGANFATMAVDSAGNLYAVWAQTRTNASGTPNGFTPIMYSYSTDNGNTWSAPRQVNTPCPTSGQCDASYQTLTNVYPWVVAGDAGRIDIAYYGTKSWVNPSGQAGPDTLTNGTWYVYMAQNLAATSSSSSFTVKEVSEHPVHYGSMFAVGQGGNGDRTSGDFMNIRADPNGAAILTYVDSANDVDLGQDTFIHQESGPSLYTAHNPVQPSTLTQNNAAVDNDCQTTNPSDSDFLADSDDASYDANGTSFPQCATNLDLQRSALALDPNNQNMLRITLQVADLTSLAPPATSGGTVVDWLTNWHQPCSGGTASCPDGGHIWHAYMESVNGGTPTFWIGHSSSECCAFITYPGLHQLPTSSATGICASSASSNCFIPGKPGKIIIDVPRSLVGSPPNYSTLYSVTSATLTLQAPGNSNSTTCSPSGPASAASINCGVLFNLIDENNTYDATITPPTAPSPPTPTPTGTPTCRLGHCP